MAYRRPAIEVIQEFQQAAAALALPSLPAVVVGPAFQIASDVNVGTYSEDDLAGTSFSYSGLDVGAIVDLTDAPEDEADANAHRSVGVTLQDAYLIKEPAAPAVSRITGRLVTPNKFQDSLTAPFASFDPDAADAPTFYVEILGGAGVDAADLGRKLVIGKTNDGELIVAAEWQSGGLPLDSVEYRVIEFREKEVIEEEEFGIAGISKDADSVDIDPGLVVPSDSLRVVEATVLLSWRALRPDLAGSLNAFTDLDSLEAVFGIGNVVPSNIGAFGVNLALQNTTTEVSFVGLNEDFYDNEEQAYQSALEFLEGKDVYGIALLTQNTAVHQLGKSHVEGMSVSSVGRERVCIINRKMAETEILAPASGIGTETTAGTGNGLSGSDNKTFRDPTNGSFITDDVGVGHYLEIIDYTPVAGSQRTVDPSERDFFGTAPSRIRIGNANFVGTDVGRYILVRGATTAANNAAHLIASIIDAERAGVSVAPTPELMPAGTRTWIANLTRSIAHNAADAVVAATKTWSFVNGAFTEDDIGRILFMAGTADAGDSGAFTIASVLSATVITTLEAPAADETFGGGVTQQVFSIDREPARDSSADSVDGTSREWIILNAFFTAEDVGRVLRIAGATAPGNNDDHVIEAVISTTKVRTDNTSVPVTEEFDGLTNVLTTLELRSVTPSETEEDYIKNTKHTIAAVVSETQLTLAIDPTGGFGGTLEDVEYRIGKNLSLNEQAEAISGYASSLGSRRIVSTVPDVLAVSVNGVATKVPGFFACPIVVGLTSGLPSQAGFTNLSVTGLVGRENSDDKFSDVQLDTIAGGGNMIFIQPVQGAALSIRHQLTTDVSTIFFQEYSVTKNVDLIARFFRGLYKPFIGIYNITEGLLDLLKTRGEGGIAFLKAQRAPRVGAPLRKGQLARIEESADQPDSVEIDIDIGVPLPLNNLKLTLLV